ncbi:hypothetical protein NOJ05_29995 [Neorhizobium galegae]|uniref:hypothetical protein n=1 Tax=Neorhizobium galegae TaxID=399 RepID=UPI000620EE84|nr:hypothetical protein [Neorhizobium galegae]MCQ1781435.1 hypothetical protein [Neorhizobium galegae]MCQ1797380.1 hypothetical protein [Neorhizobium galegae]CDZ30932.1 Hypothetical protein NGAL_HAMBI490_58050 [Neorhizobium galegae bv. officinalis]
MTNVRTNSQDAKVELDRYIKDADDSRAMRGGPQRNGLDELVLARSELAKLHEEVADLRTRLTVIRGETDGISHAPQTTDEHPWLRIGLTMLATFVLGKLVQRLRLGAPGAAAVPPIAAQIDRRL